MGSMTDEQPSDEIRKFGWEKFRLEGTSGMSDYVIGRVLDALLKHAD
jgi:hypothetical protein